MENKEANEERELEIHGFILNEFSERQMLRLIEYLAREIKVFGSASKSEFK